MKKNILKKVKINEINNFHALKSDQISFLYSLSEVFI
jgi:hypothetical protein